MRSIRSKILGKNRNGRGASLVEAILGAFILIPIALMAVDLYCLVMAVSTNDTCAKNCARAGANQPNGASAVDAANKALATFQSSGIVKSIDIEQFEYADGDKCTCMTTIVVNLPVPFPGFSTFKFSSRAVEPVVGVADPTAP